jgi:hypothetical protein
MLDGAGSDAAVAETIGESDQYVSDLRHGRRPMTAYQLFLIVTEFPGAFLALCKFTCPRHGFELPQCRKTELTPEQLHSVMVGVFAQNPALLRLLVEMAVERFGTNAEETIRALRERGK